MGYVPAAEPFDADCGMLLTGRAAAAAGVAADCGAALNSRPVPLEASGSSNCLADAARSEACGGLVMFMYVQLDE